MKAIASTLRTIADSIDPQDAQTSDNSVKWYDADTDIQVYVFPTDNGTWAVDVWQNWSVNNPSEVNLLVSTEGITSKEKADALAGRLFHSYTKKGTETNARHID